MSRDTLSPERERARRGIVPSLRSSPGDIWETEDSVMESQSWGVMPGGNDFRYGPLFRQGLTWRKPKRKALPDISPDAIRRRFVLHWLASCRSRQHTTEIEANDHVPRALSARLGNRRVRARGPGDRFH